MLVFQFCKQLEKDLRFLDCGEDEYNPQNWLFEVMQKCLLYDSVNQIKSENIFEHYRTLEQINSQLVKFSHVTQIEV